MNRPAPGPRDLAFFMLKILLGCTDSDMETILACHNRGAMRGMLVKR